MKKYIVATVMFPKHNSLYKTIMARTPREAKIIYSNIFGILNLDNIQIICDF